MQMKPEDRWHCTNPACAREVLLETGGLINGQNPRCSCGAPMKKKYVSPVLTYLDFLHLDEAPKIATREE